MDIQGQTLVKVLIIHLHVHFSTNKQWLADAKLLYNSSTFTNTTIIFMKSITIIIFAIL